MLVIDIMLWFNWCSFNVCLTIVIALQNVLRNKKIVRIIYFPIIFPDKIDNIKINIYIFWNHAFWKHACEPRRARHMRSNFTRTCVTSWVHRCGLILTRACVMPRITQKLCFLGWVNPPIPLLSYSPQHGTAPWCSHIKLGLMIQFVEALNKDGNCFKHLEQ